MSKFVAPLTLLLAILLGCLLPSLQSPAPVFTPATPRPFTAQAPQMEPALNRIHSWLSNRQDCVVYGTNLTPEVLNMAAVQKAALGEIVQICDGVDDDVEINAALDAVGSYGKVVAVGTFSWSRSPITVDNEGAILDLSGACCYYGGTGHAIEINAGTSKQQIIGLKLTAIDRAVTSTAAVAIYIDEGHMIPHISAIIEGFRAGAAVVINATTNITNWTEEVLIPHLSARTCRKGLEFTGAGQIQDVKVGFMFWSPYDGTGPNCGIINSKPSSPPNGITVDHLHCTTDTITNSTGVSYGAGRDWRIDELVWDDNTSGNTSVRGTVPIELRGNQTQGSGFFFRDARIPWSSFERALSATLGGRTVMVPLNAGWSAETANGGQTGCEAMNLRVITGEAAFSYGLLSATLAGLNVSGGWNQVNWAKRMWFTFGVGRYNVNGTDAELVGRVQFKATSAIGPLTSAGLGIQIDNTRIHLESHGTHGPATIDTGLSLNTESLQANVAMYIDPKVPVIMVFVNDAYKAQQTTGSRIPAVRGGGNIVVSMNNGSTGGVIGQMYVQNMRMWQED